MVLHAQFLPAKSVGMTNHLYCLSPKSQKFFTFHMRKEPGILFACCCCCCLVAKSCLTLATPWSVACQAPLSMGFLKQEHWSGWLFPPPGDAPNPEIEPTSSTLAGGFFTTEPPGKPLLGIIPPNYAMLQWREPWSWKPSTWRYKFLQVPPGSATCLALWPWAS